MHWKGSFGVKWLYVRDGLLGSGGPKPSAILHAKAKRRAFNLCTSASFFKINKICFGYFEPENMFVDNENN